MKFRIESLLYATPSFPMAVMSSKEIMSKCFQEHQGPSPAEAVVPPELMPDRLDHQR